jgi:hypothetical protein
MVSFVGGVKISFCAEKIAYLESIPLPQATAI